MHAPTEPATATAPDARRRIGVALYLVSLLAGVGALLFAFFPELAFGTDIPSRAIAFVNGVVSLLSGGFGLIVTTPNVPRDTTGLLRRDLKG